MRATDDEVQSIRMRSDVPRAELIGTHMSRIILHLVFQDPAVRSAYPASVDLSDLIATARQAVRPIFGKVAEYLEAQHPDGYLANFSKNSEKCESLVRYLNDPPYPTGPQEQADFWKTLGT